VEAVKFSLISATSIIALFSAAVGPSHAAVLTAVPADANIYDLVHDGVTSADGGDVTVTRQDPLVSAVMALETATPHWPESSFTGPVDPTAGTVFPRIPLGAAPGTRPDDDFATPITGAWQWNALQKAYAIGQVRIAPLIGTIGNGPSGDDKSGSTVFASNSPTGFNDGGGERSSSVAVAFAPSSTSTATITVAGAGNFRPRAGSGFSVAAANSLRAMPEVTDQAPPTVALADAAQPTLGFNYAPAPNPATKGNVVEASFSDAVTATGVFAQMSAPAMLPKIQTSEFTSSRGQPGQAGNGKIQTSELASSRGQPGQAGNGKVQTSELQSDQVRPARIQTSDAEADYRNQIDLTQPIEGSSGGIQADGTRMYISASVSAHPSTVATLYMANVVNAAPTVVTGQTVEAFQVGPTPGPRAQGGTGTTVSDPLRGKIMASAGALNNSLALP
jgi:hypothetical protein